MAGLSCLPLNILARILSLMGPIDEILKLRRVCTRFRDALKLSTLTVRDMQVTFEGFKIIRPQYQIIHLERMPVWRVLSTLNVKVLDLKSQVVTRKTLEIIFATLRVKALSIDGSFSTGNFMSYVKQVAPESALARGFGYLKELRISGIKRDQLKEISLEVLSSLKRLYVNDVEDNSGKPIPFPKTARYHSFRPLELLQVYNSNFSFPNPSSTCVLCIASTPIPELSEHGVTVVHTTVTELIEGYFASGGDLAEMERWTALGGDWNVRKNGKMEVPYALESMELENKEAMMLKLAKFLSCKGYSQSENYIIGEQSSLLNVALRWRFSSVSFFLLSINISSYDNFKVMKQIITQNSTECFNLVLKEFGRLPERPSRGCNELCFAFISGCEDMIVRLLGLGVETAKCCHGNIFAWASELTMKLFRDGKLDRLGNFMTYRIIQHLLNREKDEMAAEWIQTFHSQLEIATNESQYLTSTEKLERTPLFVLTVVRFTQMRSCIKSISCLMTLGFNPNIKDPYGWTPLIAATSSGLIEIVKSLLSSGVKINDVDEVNRAALHYAVLSGYFPIVKMLVEAGADVTVRDTQGKLPIDLADRRKVSEVERVMATKNRAPRKPKKCVIS